MALYTINQFAGSKHTTCQKLLDNIWVDVPSICPDKGVNEGFSTDTNAASARIVRQIAPGIKGRTYGATVNGAPGNSANVNTSHFGGICS